MLVYVLQFPPRFAKKVKQMRSAKATVEKIRERDVARDECGCVGARRKRGDGVGSGEILPAKTEHKMVLIKKTEQERGLRKQSTTRQ